MSSAPDPQTHGSPRAVVRRRAFVVAAAACVAAPILLRPARAATEASAGYEMLDFDWTDARRQRPVPARLYLPRTAAAGAPVPLVVFSHGIGSTRERYRWIGQHLAVQGHACLHTQHVGSDRQVWAGNPLSVVTRLWGAAQEGEAVARVADVRFALDTLLAGELAPRLDERRIVLAGHSYGANTTLLAAGAVVQREGRPLALRDDRVRAAIVLSAPPFYGEGDPQRILAGVGVPSLHVTATEDIIRIPGYYSGADDRLAVFQATGGARGPRKWLAMFEGGSHGIFTDRPTAGGALLNPQVKEATKALALAFLRAVLEDDDAAIRAWPQRFASLLSRFEASPA
ncbi:MAG: acetylhydrolase [Burkholderiales bacterium]|nr:acetylhydrolase [Burkholderiales bacterium]